jgi:hypothetical protein
LRLIFRRRIRKCMQAEHQNPQTRMTENCESLPKE